MSGGIGIIQSQHVQHLSAVAEIFMSADVRLLVFSIMAKVGSFS